MYYRNLFVIGLICLMCLSVMPLTVNAQEQILGPYLWMITKQAQDQGGAAATDVDTLAEASNNTVTEEMVAKNGATEGDKVGDYAWTTAELPANGDLNDHGKTSRIHRCRFRRRYGLWTLYIQFL